eukprot:TRINITY_DN34591_c0_g1_i1.p1 TRINITY_DN34591_c0_g1~~TRINITY_DN34591_c0_g1_i1.p1  ORF type:complete len:260 (+),score=44.87 TRINITY_DN34591_c0_g1_i1:50-829(+)
MAPLLQRSLRFALPSCMALAPASPQAALSLLSTARGQAHQAPESGQIRSVSVETMVLCVSLLVILGVCFCFAATIILDAARASACEAFTRGQHGRPVSAEKGTEESSPILRAVTRVQQAWSRRGYDQSQIDTPDDGHSEDFQEQPKLSSEDRRVRWQENWQEEAARQEKERRKKQLQQPKSALKNGKEAQRQQDSEQQLPKPPSGWQAWPPEWPLGLVAASTAPAVPFNSESSWASAERASLPSAKEPPSQHIEQVICP